MKSKPITISVTLAKGKLSKLLELAASGRSIVITSRVKPKAALIGCENIPARKPFPGSEEHLAKMSPWSGGPTAEEIIRAERDSGW